MAHVKYSWLYNRCKRLFMKHQYFFKVSVLFSMNGNDSHATVLNANHLFYGLFNRWWSAKYSKSYSVGEFSLASKYFLTRNSTAINTEITKAEAKQ